MTTEEKSGNVVCLIRFNGRKANWHEWSVKTLALAKTKGFKHVCMKDSKPCNKTMSTKPERMMLRRRFMIPMTKHISFLWWVAAKLPLALSTNPRPRTSMMAMHSLHRRTSMAGMLPALHLISFSLLERSTSVHLKAHVLIWMSG